MRSLQAAKMRCSVGEISDAMEKIFSRHVAVDRMVSGAYKSEYGEDKELEACIQRIEVRRTAIVISQLVLCQLLLSTDAP